MFNNNAFKFANIDNFEAVESMDQNLRAQQYGFNGRIFLAPDEYVRPYELYKDSNQQQDTNTSIISNIVVPNAVARTFFSNDNVERLQRQIIQEVFRVSQKQIGKQSYPELQIIMKSIYLQYSKNLPNGIEEQVKDLNNYIIAECVRIIVPNVLQYNKYLEDITSPLPVMPLAQNVSNKGSKWGDFSKLIPSTNT